MFLNKIILFIEFFYEKSMQYIFHLLTKFFFSIQL